MEKKNYDFSTFCVGRRINVRNAEENATMYNGN